MHESDSVGEGVFLKGLAMGVAPSIFVVDSAARVLLGGSVGGEEKEPQDAGGSHGQEEAQLTGRSPFPQLFGFSIEGGGLEREEVMVMALRVGFL